MMTSSCHNCTVRVDGNITRWYVCNHCNQPCDTNYQKYKKEVLSILRKLAKQEGYKGRDILSFGIVLYICTLHEISSTAQYNIFCLWSHVGYARTLENIQYDSSVEAYELFNELHRIFIRLLTQQDSLDLPTN